MKNCNPHNVRRLDGLVAVVTGANGGLGRPICRRLESEGAHIAAIDLRETGKPDERIQFTGDMTSKLDVQRVFDAIVEQHGRVDILVNNIGGGGSRARLLVDLEEEDWSSSLANNLTSTFLCTQAFAKLVIAAGNAAKIVNIASFSGKVGTPLLGPYSVAKAGVIRLTEVFARELSGHGICVNSVCPSVIDTPLSHKMLDRYPETFILAYDLDIGPGGSARAALEQKVPLGRLGEPEEVAALVAFLSSDEANYITGQAFNINGGLITH